MKVCGGLSTLVLAAALLAGAPAAMAQLPGGSAVDQYTENVPGAGGDQPGGTHGASNGTNGGGADGSAPAGTDPGATGGSSSSASPSDLSESGGGSAAGGQGAGGANASAGGSLNGASARGDVPATLTSQPVPAADSPGGDGGVGAGLPIALGVVIAASGAIYWYRRRYPETLIERGPRRAPQRSMT